MGVVEQRAWCAGRGVSGVWPEGTSLARKEREEEPPGSGVVPT